MGYNQNHVGMSVRTIGQINGGFSGDEDGYYAFSDREVPLTLPKKYLVKKKKKHSKKKKIQVHNLSLEEKVKAETIKKQIKEATGKLPTPGFCSVIEIHHLMVSRCVPTPAVYFNICGLNSINYKKWVCQCTKLRDALYNAYRGNPAKEIVRADTTMLTAEVYKEYKGCLDFFRLGEHKRNVRVRTEDRRKLISITFDLENGKEYSDNTFRAKFERLLYDRLIELENA